MWSISIYSGGIWLDCGCVMCILKAGPSVGPNPVTGKGIPSVPQPTFAGCRHPKYT
jgi:hypothetical protein